MTGLLAALTDVAPVYEIPDDDLIGEVIVPAMSHADEVWVGSGYFSHTAWRRSPLRSLTS